MRRILRKIGEGDVSNLGDTTTLADPGVVDDLVRNARSVSNPLISGSTCARRCRPDGDGPRQDHHLASFCDGRMGRGRC